MCELPIFHVYGLHLVLYEHGDVEEHVVQLRDGLLQVDEHLVPVLDVADRLPELVLVAFDLEKNMSGLFRGRIAQWKAFSLRTQRPWVRFSAFPKIIRCCRDLLTALLRTEDKGLIMSIKPI